MDRFNKGNMCITENFSFKIARNETDVKQRSLCPREESETIQNKTWYRGFGGRWSRQF